MRTQGLSYRHRIAGPAVYAVIPFIAGILLGSFSISRPLAPVFVALFFAAAAFCLRKRLTDILTIALLTAAGFGAVTAEYTITRPLAVDKHPIGTPVAVEGRIVETAVHRYGSAYFTLDCQSMGHSGMATSPASGRLPCVIYDTPHTVALSLTAGTSVRLEGMIKRIRTPLGGIRRFRTGVHRLTVQSHTGNLTVVARRASPFDTMRKRLIDAAENIGHGKNIPLMLAMTIGARDMIPDDVRDDFVTAGLAHLLAVSGLHAGIIALALYFLLNRVPINKTHGALILAVCMFCYAGVCGFRAPVTRAALMVTAVAVSGLLQRRKDTENILAATLLVILAFSPSALFTASLQLSFAAVWSITHVSAYIPQGLSHKQTVKAWFLSAVPAAAIVSATAWIATAPISSLYFGRISLTSVPVNIIAPIFTLWAVLAGMTGIVTAAAGSFFRPPAIALITFSDTCLAIIRRIAQLASLLPFASVEYRPEAFWVIAFFVWLVILSRAAHRTSWAKNAVRIALAILCAGGWYSAARAMYPSQNKAEAFFFDVGQGDAACIRTDRHTFLIDTGPRYGDYDAGRALIVPSLKALGIDTLDAVIISHLHSDHIGGLESVLDAVPVGRVFCHAFAADTLSAICDVPVFPLCAGDSLAFHDGGAFVLSPHDAPSEDIAIDGSEENNRSLVIRFDIGGKRLLFTGDIEHVPQAALSSWGNRLTSDILKIPHHGAAGLDALFLRMTSPSEAVISCGAGNRYGHPSPETTALLAKSGIVCYRTDIDGAVVVRLGGGAGYICETR